MSARDAGPTTELGSATLGLKVFSRRGDGGAARAFPVDVGALDVLVLPRLGAVTDPAAVSAR